jgi:amidase
MTSVIATDLAQLDGVGQAALVHAGQISPGELVEAAIARIEALDPTLNAVITPLFDRARDEAARVPTTAPFAGVPFLVKDLVAEIDGVPFHEGSRYLRDVVSDYDSELVRRLRAAGMVILGKTNTPEFGMVPACEPLFTGPTRNPWDIARSTSGSSGGSAAAVASRMVPMAHGNDLGGSLRYPASACGLFGLKPTRARNTMAPLYGDVFGGWGVEHALTRSVRDSAALLDATAGPAPGDPYPAPPPERPYADEVGRPPGRLRIGWTARPAEGRPVHPDCRAALESTLVLCEELGHEIVERDLPEITPDVGDAIGAVYGAATVWVVRYWSRHLGRDPEHSEVEPFTWALYEHGLRVGAGDYLLAVNDLQVYSRRVAAALADLDAWMCPTLATPPLPLGVMVPTDDDPWAGNQESAAMLGFPLVVANITGCPAMSVPMHWSPAGLPMGVNVMTRFGDEGTLFRLAGQLEEARPWADRWPPVS